MQNLDGFSFTFPRTIFVDENNIFGQVAHINSEANEAFREIPNNIRTLALEIMDTYHSAETGLRILQEKHGINLLELRDETFGKNDARSYYEP